MSRVYAFRRDPARPAQAAGDTDFIASAYEKLARMPGFVARAQQVELSRAVARSLVDNVPLLAEAPTGTGKTVAYLVGALAARETLRTRDKERLPVVLATATKGLQQQALGGDIPLLERAGIIAPGSAALAKGRANYLCPAAAERFVDVDPDAQYDLLDPETNRFLESVTQARLALEAFRAGTWDGDIDTWSGVRPQAWARMNAQENPCVGRSCPLFETCPLMRARARVGVADIVVANHDFVLRDLLMVAAGSDGLLPARYLLVLDEAHHVPAKAMDTATARLDLAQVVADLKAASPAVQHAWRRAESARVLERRRIAAESVSVVPVLQGLASLDAALHLLECDADTHQHRFVRGALDPLVEREAHALRAVLADTLGALERGMDALKSRNDTGEALAAFARLAHPVAGAVRALELVCAPERLVRWAYVNGPASELHASPMNAVAVLERLLWGASERVRPVLVSATLRDLNGFERFRAITAAPALTREFVLDSPFPYGESALVVGRLASSPRAAERAAFTEELRTALPAFLVEGTGNLVLFQSERLMREVEASVRERFRGLVQTQRSAGFKELIARHQRAVDEAGGAVLMGVATLAEGLDLPGRYCENLVIVQLPFAVPTSPVEQELAEELGPRYFRERALPDAFVRLVQMVGRLLRRETDRGRIVVLDSRLGFSSWGRRMLAALPPFTKRLEAPGDRRPVLVAPPKP